MYEQLMDKNREISNKAKGDSAEAIAVAHLEQNGFFVLKTNYENKHGEIDIIAKRNDVYHFVEVKMRVRDTYGTGRDAVTYGKQKRIRRSAEFYMIENGLHGNYYASFDVIEISGFFDNYRLEYLENCF